MYLYSDSELLALRRNGDLRKSVRRWMRTIDSLEPDGSMSIPAVLEILRDINSKAHDLDIIEESGLESADWKEIERRTEYGVDWYTIAAIFTCENLTQEELLDSLEDLFYRSCGCSHDCCGCYNGGLTALTEVDPGVYRAEVTYRSNI